MKPSSFFDYIRQSSLLAKLLAGLVVFISFTVGFLLINFLTEIRSQAQSTPATIIVNPTSATIGSGIVVEGTGWQTGHAVQIYLDDVPRDAVASAVADSQGRFTTSFLVPADPRWQRGLIVPVLAQTADTNVSARTALIINSPQPAVTPTSTVPTTLPTPTAISQLLSPPLAVITGSVIAQVDQAIEFSAGNSKANNGYQIASYAWDFGDGQTGQGVQIDHSYSKAGAYQVSLTVTDDHGLNNRATQTIEILAAPVSPPSASISGVNQAQVGQPLTFNGSGSQADGGNQLVSYTWNFGDGAPGNGTTVSHSYNAAGNYRVTLTVKDNQGLSSSAGMTVQINPVPNIAPVAAINGSTEAKVNHTVTFNAGGSYANNGSQIASFTWNFGDGGTTSGSSVSHSYGDSGNYVVTLTVTDNQGLTSTSSLTIQIKKDEHKRPSVKMRVPAKALVNQVIEMSGKGSHGGDDGRRLVNYAWNFGDGTVADGKTVSHSYETLGYYRVTLTVTDDHDLSNSAHLIIHIFAAPK